MPEAHQVQRRWCNDLEALVLLYPFGKLLRYFYVPAHVVLQSLYSVVPNHEPKLERTKTAAERDVPVAVVKDCARLGCLVAKVFGEDTQRINEGLAVGHIKTVAIEVGEQPLVGIKSVAVGKFDSILDVTELRTQCGGARHSGVHVKPEAVLAADAADGRQGIECIRRSRAHRGRNEERYQTSLPVLLNLMSQGFGPHGKALVNLN